MRLTILVIALGLVWHSAGCGCQQHGVSEVTVTPETPCLELQGGVPGKEESSIGLCEEVWLLGQNHCTEALHLPAMLPNGAPQACDVAPGAQIEHRLSHTMGPGTSYTVDATLGAQPITISFEIDEHQRW